MAEPIRVLQIVTYMGRGGLETMLMNYYRHIDRSKVQFDFLTHRAERHEYDDEIERLGGRIFRLPRLNPLSFTYRKALVTFFKTHPEYKIVHCHLDCMSGIPLSAAKKAGVPVRLAHAHSASQDKNFKYLLKLLYMKKIPSVATDLMACGEDAGHWMFNENSFHVLPNAVNNADYLYNCAMRKEMRDRFGVKDELVVGHVGRFSAVKNHTFLLRVIAALKDMHINCKLLLVGGGDLEEKIKREAHELNLDDSVIFAGIRSDVANCMQAMDVFVMPSLYEGLPVTMIEAQAAGLPCLISERIPIECKKTDLVRQLSLEEGATAWAQAVLNVSKIQRRNTYAEIAAAGFDIVENAKWLQDFYCSQ